MNEIKNTELNRRKTKGGRKTKGIHLEFTVD